MAPSDASYALLIARQQAELDNVKSTLSSWHNCMSKAYCKWPVIAAIIIGSLIVLSILFCCARCLCCGVECCCGCFSCCNACCPSPRGKRGGKYEQAPQQPYYQQPWQPQPLFPMSYGAARSPNNTATFDAPSYKNGKLNPDALPSMPSWSGAENKRVEDTSYHGAEEESIPLENHLPATVSSPLDHQQRQPLTQNFGRTSEANELEGADLGQARAHEYANDSYNSQENRRSPVSPMLRAQSPSSSSTYSARPPPSYHTTAAPPIQTQQNYSNYASQGQERAYTPYSPAGYQPYNGASSGVLNTQQLPQIHEADSQTMQSPSGRWGEQTGHQRRPLPGSWREV